MQNVREPQNFVTVERTTSQFEWIFLDCFTSLCGIHSLATGKLKSLFFLATKMILPLFRFWSRKMFRTILGGPLFSCVFFVVRSVSPPKFNMEPESNGFQMDFPFPGTYFQVPC